MVYLLLGEYGDYHLSVGRIFHVFAGKEPVDDAFHFLVAEHLADGDGCAPCHGQCERTVDLILHLCRLCLCVAHHLQEQIRDVQSLESRGYGPYRVAAVAQVGQLKAHRLQFGYDGGQALQ